MDELNDHTTLPPEVTPFPQWREKGMELLRKLSGQTWTDHNTHDPGITVLEQLCYALTDLSYRINFPVPDLMAEGIDLNGAPHFKPAEMLPSGPVSLNDWRKVLIDTDGVRNAWIQPLDTTSEQYDSRVYYDPVEEALRLTLPLVNRDSKQALAPIDMRGLYRVVFIPEPGQNPEAVKRKLRSRLLERRNLGEDFHAIEVMASQAVEAGAVIEIGEVSDPALLMARICFAIHSYLSPGIRFYTLQERLASGFAPEDLYDGPLLDHGFLDDRELDAFQVRRSVRISDLIRLIMELEGVQAVRELRLTLPGSSIVASTEEGDPWELRILESKAPVLVLPGPNAPAAGGKGILFTKRGMPYHVSWATALEKLDQLKRAEAERTRPRLQDTGHPAFDPGRQRQIAVHQSIQHQFPEVYGIGEIGLPRPASPQRSAQARQLKAYLAIFDQLLANAFAQIGGAGRLFSLAPGSTEKTYFAQSMHNEIPDFDPLIRWEALNLDHGDSKWRKGTVYQEKLSEWTEAIVYGQNVQEWTEEKNDTIVKSNLWERRNRLLNHLLARFGEEVHERDAVLKKQLLTGKETLLGTYPQLGRDRGKAFDYTRPMATDSGAADRPGPVKANVSGLERRLALLLGFPTEQPVTLSGLTEDHPGGFHLVEHILLRPVAADKYQQSPILKLPADAGANQPPLTDPFSLQVSFYFPAWLHRFQDAKNPGFRQAVVRILREETPAHLRIFVRWLDRDQMASFEEVYLQWMESLQKRQL